MTGIETTAELWGARNRGMAGVADEDRKQQGCEVHEQEEEQLLALCAWLVD